MDTFGPSPGGDQTAPPPAATPPPTRASRCATLKLFIPGPEAIMPRTLRLWSADEGGGNLKPVARMVPLPLVPLLSAAPRLMAACERMASLGHRLPFVSSELADAMAECAEAYRLARGTDGADDPRSFGTPPGREAAGEAK